MAGATAAADAEKFPLLWFYFERGVRLLGERQDIAAILGAEFMAN